ncbi:MAG: dTMP kinase [Spirochaetota bacterium]
MAKPLFIVIEGIDGSGKSSLVKNLVVHMQEQGRKAVSFCEPTKKASGMYIRRFLRGEFELSKKEQLAAFLQDRHVSVAENVLPALAAEKTVVLDRYYYSTAAYQASDEYPAQRILQTNLQENFPLPNYLFYLELPPEEAIRRISGRNSEKERFEELSQLQRIAADYAKILPPWVEKLDARSTQEQLLTQLWRIVSGNVEKNVKNLRGFGESASEKIKYP